MILFVVSLHISGQTTICCSKQHHSRYYVTVLKSVTETTGKCCNNFGKFSKHEMLPNWISEKKNHLDLVSSVKLNFPQPSTTSFWRLFIFFCNCHLSVFNCQSSAWLCIRIKLKRKSCMLFFFRRHFLFSFFC